MVVVAGERLCMGGSNCIGVEENEDDRVREVSKRVRACPNRRCVCMPVYVCTISRTDVEASTGRHYASLGNLANDSIEAAGMSSMWT